MTIANLSTLAHTGGEADANAFMLHYALWGAARLVDEGGLTTFERPVATLVSQAAFNVATVITQRLQDVEGQPDATSRAVINNLATIAAASAVPLAVDDDYAQQILALLDLRAEDAIGTLTALSSMGGTLQAWGERSVDIARLAAVGAVAVAAGPDSRTVPSRLFNAGVSLIAEVRAGRTPELIRAQLLLNALGVRWSLQLAQGEVTTAMTEFDGLDCAVNLLSTAVKYREDRVGSGSERDSIQRPSTVDCRPAVAAGPDATESVHRP